MFGMMGVLNFAHTAFYMIGAYTGFVMARSVGFWWGLVAAPIIVGLIGLLVQKYLLKRVHKFGRVRNFC